MYKRPAETQGVGRQLGIIFDKPHGPWRRVNGLFVRERQTKLLGRRVLTDAGEVSAHVVVKDVIQDARLRPSYGFSSPSRPPRGMSFTGRFLSVATHSPENNKQLFNHHKGAMNGTYDLDRETGELEAGVARIESIYVDNGARLLEYLAAIVEMVRADQQIAS